MALQRGIAVGKERKEWQEWMVNKRLLLFHPNLSEKTIALPKGAELCEMTLSPIGDKLAWLFYFEPSQSKPLLPEQPTLEIWVSRYDGSGMYRLGYQALSPNQKIWYKGADYIRYLSWLPSGQKLSYLYNNILYGVSLSE